MPVTHKVFLGGLPQPYTYGREMFPSVDFPPFQRGNVDYRKFTSQYANSRHIDFSCASQCMSCGEVYTESEQLKNYFDKNPLAVGDVVELIGISMENIIEGVWWKIAGALPGFEFQMQIRGDAAGTIDTPVDVGPVIDAGVVGSGFVEFSPKLYTTSNAMLQLVVTALPTAVPNNCNSCTGMMLSGLNAWFSVIGFEPCRGDMLS